MNVVAKTGKTLPLLDLDVLRTFEAIADTGSFTAAAEIVFRTPSAVSMQIKKLEELIGKSVFVRDSRSVAMTRDGELLLEHARRMLALNRDAVARFIVPDVAGEVRLGAPDDVAERFLPDMLRRFAESHPAITVNVIVENSKPLAEKVARKEIDLAMVTCDTVVPEDSSVEILFREKLIWAALKCGVAAEQDPLPVSVWEEGCVWRSAGFKALEKAGRRYRIAFQSSYVSGQKAAILADLAVAPLPVSAATDPIVAADAKFGLPSLPEYALGLVVSPDAHAAVEAAADHLRASFADRMLKAKAA
jgi:DNA-binding transcriptional LysR family regulator